MMVLQNYLLSVLLANICIFGIASSFDWPSNIPKCKPADEICIPQTLTRLLRHVDEYPEFNIPKLDPFKMKKSSVLRTRNPNSPISLVIHNSNVTIYGLSNIEIKQIKGFGPDPKNTKLEIKSFVPTLISLANYKSTMNLFALPITTEGVSNTTILNVETRQNIEFDVIERDGKEYVKIKNVRPHLKLTNFSVQFKSKTGNPTVENTINKVINENWRELYAELKPDLEKNVGEVIKSIMSPLFDKVPYQEFFLQ